jgi:hypothetical protein
MLEQYLRQFRRGKMSAAVNAGGTPVLIIEADYTLGKFLYSVEAGDYNSSNSLVEL